MYFAKDEIIELKNGKKYLILDTAIIDNKSYYKIISAINNDGDLFIDEKLADAELQKLSELFEE